jgi:hypothetical protein
MDGEFFPHYFWARGYQPMSSGRKNMKKRKDKKVKNVKEVMKNRKKIMQREEKGPKQGYHKEPGRGGS